MKKTVFTVAVIVLFTVGLLEIATRVLFPAQDPDGLKPYLDLARTQGFPADKLEEHLKSLRYSGPAKYADYYIYGSRPHKLPTADFTGAFSTRRTPDSVAEHAAKCVIWAFGGSTMANMETTDELTITNTIARVMRQKEIDTLVLNFGTGGFQSTLESIKFQDILRKSPGQHPQIAVFYDGFNDPVHGYWFGAGRFQGDLPPKLADLVERNYPRLGLYIVSEMLSEYSRFWSRFIRPKIAKLYQIISTKRGLDDLDQAVSIYLDNVRIDDAVCQAFGIQCLFVLQPMITSKAPLIASEKEFHDTIAKTEPGQLEYLRGFYAAVRKRLDGDRRFIDLSQVLNGRAVPDFYDFGHTGPYTSPIIGAKLAEMILARADAPGCRPR